MENLYDVLGCSRTASTAEMKELVRKARLRNHPDRNQDVLPVVTSNQFIKVERAWNILKCPIRRKNYDALYNQYELSQGSAGYPVQMERRLDEFEFEPEPSADSHDFQTGYFWIQCRCGGMYLLDALAAHCKTPFISCCDCSLALSEMPDFLTEDVELPAQPPPFQASTDDHRATRQRQALFLRQSLLIAHRFSENPVTPAMLYNALPWLEREQYDNLAIERNALGHCGYVLCPNPFTSPIRQTYRIRYGSRQIFDTEERKPYCSDWCFSASMHIRKQISKEPSWCRSTTYIQPKLSLYPKCKSGRPGKMVLDALRDLRLTDEETESKSSDAESDGHAEISTVDSDGLDDGFDSDDELSAKRSPDQPKETCWGKEVILPQNMIIKESHSPSHSNANSPLEVKKQTCDENSNSCPVSSSLFDCVLDRMFEWLTPMAYFELTHFTPTTKSMTFADNSDAIDECSKDSTGSTVLPLIDSVSVMTVRRNLWLEEFLPSFRFLFNRLAINEHPILEQLTNAIQHFRLTNRNIHMHRSQRGLTSLLLLRLMSISQPTLQSLLNDKDQMDSLLLQFTSQKNLHEFEYELMKPILDAYAVRDS